MTSNIVKEADYLDDKYLFKCFATDSCQSQFPMLSRKINVRSCDYRFHKIYLGNGISLAKVFPIICSLLQFCHLQNNAFYTTYSANGFLDRCLKNERGLGCLKTTMASSRNTPTKFHKSSFFPQGILLFKISTFNNNMKVFTQSL